MAAQVHGTCAPQFEKVRTLLQQFVDSGEEIGACIAVNVNGVDVVDLWGGFTNQETGTAWAEDTIVGVASSSKMISSLAVLALVNDGVLSVRDKVARHWPEFAAAGKQDIEIRHLLSHTSGVAGWDEPITMDEICDPILSAAKLAAQSPWWEPGTASAYHAFTFGHLLSEVVRRVTGMGLKQFIAEKVAAPTGADFQLGILEKDVPRSAPLIMAPPPPPPSGSDGGAAAFKFGPLFMKAVANPPMPPNVSTRPAWRQGEIGASNGYSNARAMNRLLSSITLAGRTDAAGEGGRLPLSKSTVDLIFEEQSWGTDLAIGLPIRFGIGYAIKGEGDWVDDWLPAGDIAYWGGSGGSLGIMDVGRGVTITYAMNKRSPSIIGNTASKAYVGAIYEALGVKIR